MGHPNEEWLRAFFDKHRKDIELWSPKALVTRALEEWQKHGSDRVRPDRGEVRGRE